MRIEITDEAQEYIKENGYTAMIYISTITGCCGGTAPLPQIHLGLPKDLSGYEQEVIGEITIFINKSIVADKQIEITLGKLFRFKKLSVEID